MTYFLKRLGHQELGSINTPGGQPSRGRYIYISKNTAVLSFFPPLSKYIKNDSSLLPIIPLYSQRIEKVYSNYIYHNDKYNGSTAASPRDEYRIYSNNSLEQNQYLFQTGDIIVMKKQEITENDETQIVYFLERITSSNTQLYQECERIISSYGRPNDSFAIYEGNLSEIEDKIQALNINQLQVVVDSSVTEKIETSNTDLANLFNAASFRDFTMVAYEKKCAVTRTIIKYKDFLNLEAAHIKPKSHGGQFMPNNGLALSRDIHWAFDKGFFTLADDFTILVHSGIDSDFLKQYEGESIYIPDTDFLKPSLESIQYHRENVFGLFLTSGRL